MSDTLAPEEDCSAFELANARALRYKQEAKDHLTTIWRASEIVKDEHLTDSQKVDHLRALLFESDG